MARLLLLDSPVDLRLGVSAQWQRGCQQDSSSRGHRSRMVFLINFAVRAHAHAVAASLAPLRRHSTYQLRRLKLKSVCSGSLRAFIAAYQRHEETVCRYMQ